MTNEFAFLLRAAKREKALLLWHVTGGDENDLLQLRTIVSPNSVSRGDARSTRECLASSAAWPKAYSMRVASGLLLSNGGLFGRCDADKASIVQPG